MQPKQGLGSSLWTHTNRGNLECEGSKLEYKHPRTDCSGAGNKNLYQISKSEVYSHPNRQHCSPVIPSKNGGNWKHADECNNKKDLELSGRKQYQPDSRMDPNTSEHVGRLGVKALSGLKRMETLSEYIPQSLPKIWKPRPGPVRIQELPPTSQICKLEAGSTMPVCRRIQPKMEPIQALCIPTFLPNNKGHPEGFQGSSTTHDPSNSPMVNPTMVPMLTKYVSTKTPHSATITRPVEEPKAGKPPTNQGVKPHISGMEHIRSSLKAKGISTESADIISNSRAKGTTTTYGYAWNKWMGWCQQRKIDPSDSTLGEILDFMTFLFHQKNAKHRYLGVSGQQYLPTTNPLRDVRWGNTHLFHLLWLVSKT